MLMIYVLSLLSRKLNSKKKKNAGRESMERWENYKFYYI